MEVNGYYGKSLVAIEVIGCYGMSLVAMKSHWLLLKSGVAMEIYS
jgi:hypothetical protein